MVLKTGPVRPVGLSADHRFGSVQSLDQMETKPRLDRLNRRSNRCTGRFRGNQSVQMIFFFKASNDVVFVAYISKIKTSSLQPCLLEPPSAVTPTRQQVPRQPRRPQQPRQQPQWQPRPPQQPRCSSRRPQGHSSTNSGSRRPQQQRR